MATPTPTEDVLRSYGLAGEPITFAPVAMQPVIAAIRRANLDAEYRPLAVDILAAYDADVDAANVLVEGPPSGAFTVAVDSDRLAVIATDSDAGLGLPFDNVQWDFGDGKGPTFDSSDEVEHIYSSPGVYLITKKVAVAGTVYQSGEEVVVGDVPVGPGEPIDPGTPTEPGTGEPVDPGTGETPITPGTEPALPQAMLDTDDYTVPEVNLYADAHRDDKKELKSLLKMEQTGKNRVGVTDHLERLIEAAS